MTARATTVAALLAHLEAEGVLLVQDKALPSLATLVAGGPVRGSWWGHRHGHAIYALAGELLAHPDVLPVKLISKKDTLVHRRWWAPVASVGRAREAWQVDTLSRAARDLLYRVDREEAVLTSGDPARELEYRLLVVGRGVHTESGAHHKEVVSWGRWLAGRGVVDDLDVGEAKEQLESLLVALNRRTGGSGRLPWGRGRT